MWFRPDRRIWSMCSQKVSQMKITNHPCWIEDHTSTIYWYPPIHGLLCMTKWSDCWRHVISRICQSGEKFLGTSQGGLFGSSSFTGGFGCSPKRSGISGECAVSPEFAINASFLGNNRGLGRSSIYNWLISVTEMWSLTMEPHYASGWLLTWYHDCQVTFQWDHAAIMSGRPWVWSNDGSQEIPTERANGSISRSSNMSYTQEDFDSA